MLSDILPLAPILTIPYFAPFLLSSHTIYPFLICGITVKLVGIERQQPIKKSLTQIYRKSACQPRRKSKMPTLIKAVIAMETNDTKGIVPCILLI